MEEQLRDFIATCGRMPDPHSPLRAEAELARRNGCVGHQHEVEDLFLLRAQHVNTHRRATGSWPSRYGIDAYEASLAAWLSYSRNRRIPQRRAELLDRMAPGWRLPSDAVWEQRLREAIDFHRRHQRVPSRTSQNLAERRLSQWLADQRRQLRAGAMYATRQVMWHEAMSMLDLRAAA